MWNSDGTAGRHSELILAIFTLFDAVRVFKKIRRIQLIVSEKLPYGAMQFVGPLFDCGIENGSSGPTKLRAEACRLDLEFLNRVDRGKNNKVRTIQEIHGIRIVINTIEQVIVLRWPKSIGGKSSIGGIAACIRFGCIYARGELGQECEIPSVQGKIIDVARVHNLAHGTALGFEHRRSRRYFHD